MLTGPSQTWYGPGYLDGCHGWAFDSLMADMGDRTVGLAAAAVQLVGGIEGQLSFGWQLPSVAARKKGLIGRCGVGYQRASDPRPTLDRP